MLESSFISFPSKAEGFDAITLTALCVSFQPISPSKAEGFDATAGEGTSIQDGGCHGVQPQYDSVGEIVMNH